MPQSVNDKTRMKVLTIVFTISILTGFSQSKQDYLINDDSVSLFPTETSKLILTDTIFWTTASSTGSNDCWISVPTCSCLKLRNGVYYLENDSQPYQGDCVVATYIQPAHLPYQFNNCNTEISPGTYQISNFMIIYPTHIKIISRYKNGKRDGNREYYDKTGKPIKTEIYSNGILVKTNYP